MRQKDAYQLTNLAPGRKILASLALLLGLVLFLSGWVASVLIVNWDSSLDAFVHFGAMLGMVSGQAPVAYWLLLAAHAFSLALLLFVTRSLFRRTPLPRTAQSGLLYTGFFLASVDVAGWFSAPHFAIAAHALGATVLLLTTFWAAIGAYLLRAMWRVARPRSGAKKRRVVVVGGGFAGLYTAMGLDRALGHDKSLEIVVIDKNNYFLFPPLLPSVAAGAIETRQVTYPFRRMFEATNVKFRKELVESIDTGARRIRSRVDVDQDAATGVIALRHAETSYDYLVLAPGSTSNTFGTPGVGEHAFFMREVGDAVALRNQVIDCFERAARESDPQIVDEMLRFVIVGAGPTGVELASEVRELIADVLLKHYQEIATESVSVVLVQSGDRILPGWSAGIAETSMNRLSTIGVRLELGRRVVGVGPDSIELDDGRVVATRTCVWCAGVKPSPLLEKTGLPLHRSGRVAVDTDCRVKGRPDVFVLGDAAFMLDPAGKPLPPLGQVAFQQGAHTAKNLVRLLEGEETRPFAYFDFGQLVSVGARYAAVDLLGVKLTGFFAWFVWRTLYLLKLVGFSNKVRVMLDWSLDLLLERSISQLQTRRASLEAHALAEARKIAAE